MSQSNPPAQPDPSAQSNAAPKNSRRAKIEEMLKDEPDDIFLRYSLAMELTSDGDFAEALTIYEGLTKQEPPYVPAFFRSAQLLADEDNVEAAREFLRSGIEVARQQGDLHSAGEMSEMLSDLGQLGS